MTNAEARFNKSHIRKVYACLAVTCHLHFWQNDRDLLRATAVTWGLNGYRNKSQHRKSTLEKKILPLFQQGFKPATFQSRVRRCNHWAIPATNHHFWLMFVLCLCRDWLWGFDLSKGLYTWLEFWNMLLCFEICIEFWNMHLLVTVWSSWGDLLQLKGR